MRAVKISQVPIILFLLAFLFANCNKNDDGQNPPDPSNLSIRIDSIDNQTGFVAILAQADNAIQYRLYIDNADSSAGINETGYFEFTFGKIEAQYEITVRAYGPSGRYVKASQTVGISPQPAGPVPLDSGYFSPMSYDGYDLVWHDEFNGTNVDMQNWTFETGGNWYNNELQFYKSDNAWVADSVLTIEARKEDYGGRNYTSARMITQGKKSFVYGRIDIRAVLPEGQGMWPALWTLGNDINTVGWPKCGEIDIMEMIGGSGREKTVHSTLHWDDNGQADYGGSYTSTGKTFAEKYHVFSLVWDETLMKFYVDDHKFFEVDITPAGMSEFHQKHFFIFNLAVGGIWPGNPDATTMFPQKLKVDYIRVFQKQ